MVKYMKRIKLSEYNPSLGILIDVQHPDDYLIHPTMGQNIYADKLLLNYKNILSKNKKYYIVCNKGYLSRRVVAVLEFYGYDVTQVIKDY